MLRLSILTCLLLAMSACSPPTRSAPEPPEPTCTDGKRNGDETDVDCGGATCDPCGDAQACRADEDCAQGTCAQGNCRSEAATCDAEKKPWPFQCSCATASDCFSGACTDSLCGAKKVVGTDHYVSSIYEGRVGERFAFDCAPGVTPASVWGTGIYTLDSGVCTAAVHSGRFTFAAGGRVVIEIWAGQRSYAASEQNGVSSRSWGSYQTSFAVLPVTACLDGVLSEGETDIDCGGECGACADGQGCSDAEDCSSGHCVDGTCSPETCWNGRKDRGEEEVDCGGSCAPCIPPQSCFDDADCDVGSCVAFVCGDVPACDAHPNALASECACTQATKCFSKQCNDSLCDAMDLASDPYRKPMDLSARIGERFAFDCPPNASTSTVYGTDIYTYDSSICAAAMHSGLVTEAEGGRVVIQMWPKTKPFKASTRHGVKSRAWGGTSAAYVFLPLTRCLDGLKSEGETDVDCGGDACAACDLGQACVASTDCQSNHCESGECAKPLCENGRLDEGETDVDCGGDCPKCELGHTCAGTDENCQTGAECRDNVCERPYCKDGVKGQQETDVDCGGPDCAPCRAGGSCVVATDCAGALCVENVCVTPTCSDGARNGLETDVDCGGPVCAPCGLEKACDVAADCESRNCGNKLCVETDGCFNRVKDGDESDVDCGGSCGPCGGGAACGTHDDCHGNDGCVDNACVIPVATKSTSMQERPAYLGRHWTFECPAGLGPRSVWGVDVYTYDTSICSAAVHAGLMTFESGGIVTVEERRGLAAYGGSNANGVRSFSYGPYHRSYAFVPPGACANGVTDGDETDVDCGGGACAKCGPGAACASDGDCQKGSCFEGHCGL